MFLPWPAHSSIELAISYLIFSSIRYAPIATFSPDSVVGPNSSLICDADIDPEDVDYYSLRGSIKKESNDLKGAIKDYSKAIKLDP